jgi:hypothetical protein
MLAATLMFAGCGGPDHRLQPVLPPVPLEQAAGLVNRNIASITGTIRASGSVDGQFVNDRGRKVRYSASGVLFYLAPNYVRLDLKKLGERQFLFGSNESNYWVYSKPDDRYFCGSFLDPSQPGPSIPVRADHIPAALGLAPILTDGLDGEGLRHKVSGEYQHVRFVTHDARGRETIEREYWLDRRPPRLVRRVILHDARGDVVMVSDLSNYREVAPGGPLLPHSMIAVWPGEGARMEFDVGRWELVPQVGPDGPQFITPAECQTGIAFIQ